MVLSQIVNKAQSRMSAAGMPAKRIKRETSFALQIINSSKQLQECSPISVLKSIVNIANTNLSLNPVLAEAYLVSRYSRAHGKECTLMPSYRGLIKLALNSDVVDIMANVVRKGDDIKVTLTNTDNPITHNYSFEEGGDIIGAYAIATYNDGKKHAEVMRLAEIEAIRETSDSWKAYNSGKIKSCVWVDHFSEMCRKTAIRRLFKQLPTSSSKEFNTAIELDNIDYSAPSWLTDKIEYNLKSANIPEEEREDLYRRLDTNMSIEEANEINNYLMQNQLHGSRYNGGNDSMKGLAQSVEHAVEMPNT